MIFNETSNEWKVINYRNIDSLVTAEFLHELYNRHIPEINSIRFMHTACFVENDEFTSWAPVNEWNMLAEVLGKRFLVRDHELVSYVLEYINKPKNKMEVVFKAIESFQYDDVERTFWLLLKLHSTALGEIYGINLVQIEHALEWALTHDKNIASDFASSLRTIDTIVVQEKRYALMLSLNVDEKIMSIQQAVEDYVHKFGSVSCAYGAEGTDAEERLKILMDIDIKERRNMLRSIETKEYKEDKKTAEQLTLPEIASLIAKLRDDNKALMGKVATYRRQLMQHIASCYDITDEKFRRYLLSDIYALVFKGAKLTDEILKERYKLVVFLRNEDFCTSRDATNLYEKIVIAKQSNGNRLTGECASAGVITGKVRIAENEFDCKKIASDEIMVSRGTDFNLLIGLQECSGVITEEGGILSHASVVSRELAKPCLINVTNATGILQTGDVIELNATNGFILVKDRVRRIYESDMSAYGVIELKDGMDAQVYGNKASNLAKCLSKGFAVLPGYILNAEMKISNELAQHIITLFRQKDNWFGHLIVRSSSTLEDDRDKSFAGAFDSLVSSMDVDKLTLALREVKQSIDTCEYANNQRGKMAILVQPYLKQDKGGVAFSKNPVTGKREIVIEYSKQGATEITQGGNVKRSIIQYDELIECGWKQQVLDTMIKLESLFGTPVDVEWGMVGNKIYIFQVRPITT